MRCLDRNKVSLYYANFNTKTPYVDGDGFETGEYVLTYTSPAKIKGNISVASGNTKLEIFGVDTNYSKIITFDKDYGINEKSILFIGIEPVMTGTQWNNNYIVERVSKSLNFVFIAIKEVNNG